MTFLADLWLPILLSAVFVFIVSSIIHMVLPIHKADYKKLAGEDKILAAMRDQGVQPGEYNFPCAGSMKDMGSEEMIAKYNQGPVGLVTIMANGVPGMGKSLLMWFLFSILISIFAAYVGSLGLSPAAEYLQVFRITGTVAVLGYGVNQTHNSIWKGLPWSITIKFIIDGIIYGLVTAATFAWLWPPGG